MIAAVALAVAAVSAGSGAAAPARLALSVSPAHVALDAGGTATVHIGGTGGRRFLLRTSVAGLSLDARGRPKIARPRDAATWLTVRPRTTSTGPDGATFVIRSRRPPHVRPGDHSAIVLVAALASARNAIAVELRVGLVVTVRVAGRSVRRVEAVAARARRLRGGGRLISVTVANRGDVIEAIGGGQLEVALLRHGRPIARFRVPRRKVLPRTSAVVALRWRGAVPGAVLARIAVAGPGGGTTVRTFRLRL
jgi:hypothetical protein